MNDLLFEASGLTRRYRSARTSLFGPAGTREAVRDVDLELRAGERLGIVGESGSGKSTLLRLLLALEHPDAGSVRYRDREVRHGRPGQLRWFRREVQLVPQDPASSLNPRMSVAQLVAEPLVCLGVAGDHRQRIAEVLTAVGLEPGMSERRPDEFSGGQRQRIAIARAIAPGPRVLIGDEPVSALDASVRVQILDLLRELADTRGLSLVFVSHDLGVVRFLCDRVLVLHEGQVVERGDTEDVFRRPQHGYTQRLLAAVPRVPQG